MQKLILLTLLLSGCAVRHVVRDPNTGGYVSSSTDRKIESAEPGWSAWSKETTEFNGRIVEVWCRRNFASGDTVCKF